MAGNQELNKKQVSYHNKNKLKRNYTTTIDDVCL